MTKTIYKYVLKPIEMQDIELPIDAEILTVQNQDEEVCMWVKLDPDEPKVHRTFAVFGTGWRIVSNATFEYVGTVQLWRENLVYHVFEWVMKKE